MKGFEKNYHLDPEGICMLVEDLRQYLEENEITSREVFRTRFVVEDLLLRIMDDRTRKAGDAADHGDVSLRCQKKGGGHTILLKYGGDAFDPTEAGENDLYDVEVLQRLGYTPTWRYRGKINRVQMRLTGKSGRSQLVLVLLAILAGGIIGAGGMFLPDVFRDTATTALLTPFVESFFGLLNTFAGLMVFFSIVSGVIGIGDTASLSKIGKSVMVRFLAIIPATATMALFLCLPFVHLKRETSGGGDSQLEAISQMVFNMLPRNPVQPFLDGNVLQIVVMGVFVGAVLLVLGEQSRRVAELVNDLSTVLNTMLSYVCRLIPLFVFVSLTRMIWSGVGRQFLALWKPFLLMLLINILLSGIMLILAALKAGVSPVRLMKTVAPPVLIAFSTASSMAAYSTTKQTLEKKLGIDLRLINFALPVGTVTFMPASAVIYLAVCLCLSEIYGIPVDVPWFIELVLVSTLLAIAAPPIPGGGITCYSILIAQFGIPAEGLVMATTLEIFADFFLTAFIVLHLELELVRQASILRMLDRDVLHRAIE